MPRLGYKGGVGFKGWVKRGPAACWAERAASKAGSTGGQGGNQPSTRPREKLGEGGGVGGGFMCTCQAAPAGMQSRRGCPKNGSHSSAQKLCVGVTGGHRWGGWVAGGKKRGGGVENRWRCGKEGPLGPRHNETGGETGTDERTKVKRLASTE